MPRAAEVLQPAARDDASQSSISVYATTCELFQRVDIFNESVTLDLFGDSKSRGGGGGAHRSEVSLRGPPQNSGEEASRECDSALLSLAGEWAQSDRPEVVIRIDGSSVFMISPTGEQRELRLAVLEDGRVELRNPIGDVRCGQLVGDRLLWDSGETWRRARGGSHPNGMRRDPTARGGCGALQSDACCTDDVGIMFQDVSCIPHQSRTQRGLHRQNSYSEEDLFE